MTHPIADVYLNQHQNLQVSRASLKIGITDFARANNGYISEDDVLPNGQAASWAFLTCSPDKYQYLSYINSDGSLNKSLPCAFAGVFVPTLNIDLISTKLEGEDYIKTSILWKDFSVDTETFKNEMGIEETRRIISFKNLVAPQSRVNDVLRAEIFEAIANGTAKQTNQQFSGSMKGDKSFRKALTYVYKGKLYAVIKAIKNNKGLGKYKDGSPIRDGELTIFEVEPIKFIIDYTCWKTLPTFINPNGIGSIDFILSIRAQEGIVAGIPFSMENSIDYNSDACDAKRYMEEFVNEHLIDMDAIMQLEKNDSSNEC